MKTAEINTHYQVNVVGRMWQGSIGCYSYEFQSLPTLQDVRSKAGDFESVEDCEVIKSTSTFQPSESGYKRTTETEIVRSWDTDVSAEIYLDCMA